MVETVAGQVSDDELGVTLAHEHILWDLTCYWKLPEELTRRRLAEGRVSLENLGEVRMDALVCRDNLIQDDVDLAIDELFFYKRAGGKSIIDLTNVGMFRDPLALRAISMQTGLNIIAGCGFYVEKSHPARISSMSVDEITEEIVNDLTRGMQGTQVKAGIIGEIGTSWPITTNEEKVLRAAARAHKKTKAAINIHPFPFGKSSHHKILDIMEEEGVELRRVILSHIDECGFDMEYQKSIAKRGSYLGYDTFGSEMYFEGGRVRDPSDWERVDGLTHLIQNGYAPQLVLSHDTAYKIMLRRYGGYGYGHLLTHIIPMMLRKGITHQQINQMLIENPKKILTNQSGQ
jgi:phosphotriesterase-related protein